MIPRSRKNDENDPPPPGAAGPAGIVRRAFGHGSDPQRELERVLQERRAELEEYAARFEETALELGRREERLRDERASVERLIRRSTVELEAREKELVAYERELGAREERQAAAEEDLARRRGDLGAVELMRAALERRERDVEAREAELSERETEIEPAASARTAADTAVELLFVPGDGYRLVGAVGRDAASGSLLELEGEEYVVSRIGRSPLPRDTRRCAYLVRGVPRVPGGGSR
jgi:hypothetical protein